MFAAPVDTLKTFPSLSVDGISQPEQEILIARLLTSYDLQDVTVLMVSAPDLRSAHAKLTGGKDGAFLLKTDSRGCFRTDFKDGKTLTGGVVLFLVIKIGINDDENILICRQPKGDERQVLRLKLRSRSVTIEQYDAQRKLFAKAPKGLCKASIEWADKQRLLRVEILPTGT